MLNQLKKQKEKFESYIIKKKLYSIGLILAQLNI